MDQLLAIWPVPLLILAFGLPILSVLILFTSESSVLPRGLLWICSLTQCAAGLSTLSLPQALNHQLPLGGILWTFHLDQTTGFWLTLLGTTLGILTFCGMLNLPRHRLALLLLAIACAAAASFQDDLLWLLMLVSCCGWLSIAAVSEDIARAPSADGGRWQDLPVWCGLFLLADLLAIGGLQLLFSALPHLHLSQLSAALIWEQVAQREPALLNSAATLLWGMMVIRLGLYPGISWLKAASRTQTSTLIVLTVLWPLGQLTWFRLQPLLQLAPETRLLTAGLSAVSLALLGFLVCGTALQHDKETASSDASLHIDTLRCLLYLAVGWNATICLTTSASASSFFSTVMLPLLASSGGLGLLLLHWRYPTSRLLAVLAGLGAAAALPGFGWCLGTAFYPFELPSLPSILGWMTALGQLLLWCGLLKLVIHQAPRTRPTIVPFAAAAITGATGWLCIVRYAPQLQAPVAIPSSQLMAAGILLAALLIVAARGRLRDRVESESVQSLSRLAEREFYLNEILEQVIAYPMWCLHLVVAYLSDGLFLRVIPSLTRTLGSSTSEALDELDAPTARGLHWEVVLLTTLALGLAVWVMN